MPRGDLSLARWLVSAPRELLLVVRCPLELLPLLLPLAPAPLPLSSALRICSRPDPDWSRAVGAWPAVGSDVGCVVDRSTSPVSRRGASAEPNGLLGGASNGAHRRKQLANSSARQADRQTVNSSVWRCRPLRAAVQWEAAGAATVSYVFVCSRCRSQTNPILSDPMRSTRPEVYALRPIGQVKRRMCCGERPGG